MIVWNRLTGRRSAFLFSASLLVAILLLMVMVGCNKIVDSNGNQPKAVPPGTVSATLSAQTDATLHVKEDGTFEFVSVTRRSTTDATGRRLATTTTIPSVTRVVLTGTSYVDGITATLKITSAKRNDVELADADLGQYTGCNIVATLGTVFHEQVIQAIANCLVDAGDVSVADGVRVNDHGPSQRLVGDWRWVSMRILPYSDVQEADYSCAEHWQRPARRQLGIELACPVLERSADNLVIRTYRYHSEGPDDPMTPIQEGGQLVPELGALKVTYSIEALHTAIADMTLTQVELCDSPSSPSLGRTLRCEAAPYQEGSARRLLQRELPIHYVISDDGQYLTIGLVDVQIFLPFLGCSLATRPGQPDDPGEGVPGEPGKPGPPGDTGSTSSVSAEEVPECAQGYILYKRIP